MRHLTKRAEAVLAASGEANADLQAAEYLLACTAQPCNMVLDGLITLNEVRGFVTYGKTPSIPDCPKCAVLWDQAVAAGEVVKQKAAWLKADEDDNEKFWETLNTGHKYKRSDT